MVPLLGLPWAVLLALRLGLQMVLQTAPPTVKR